MAPAQWPPHNGPRTTAPSRSHPDYPQGKERRFVAWANGTRCALTEDVRGAWVWRKQCMVGLLITAVATGRTALVHQAMGGVYNLGHIQRWCVDTPPVHSLHGRIAH